MTRIGVILVVVALALTACDESRETGATTEIGTSSAEPDARTVAVYSAIVRQLVLEDHTFGEAESPFERVFVNVHIDVDPDADPQTGERLTAEEQAAILHELGDLPRVEFVEDPDSVIVGKKGCPHVRGNGVLITLGPISGGSERVTVPNDMFFACLGGQWLTYVVESSDEGWKVVGTRGPIGIS